MQGKILAIDKTNYLVLVDDKQVSAKPLGKLFIKEIRIVVGDNVIIEKKNNNYQIVKILERKNYFERPNIANIDSTILISSITQPKINFNFLNKLITIYQAYNIVPILLFTKLDLNFDQRDLEEIKKYQALNYQIFLQYFELSDEKLQEIRNFITNKTFVIVGKSGVGKSTFANKLLNINTIKTATISNKMKIGKHTTSKISTYFFDKNTLLIDTPGFSALTIKLITKNELAWFFLNFGQFANKCKLNQCLHHTEIKCNVKQQVTNGLISKSFYDSYIRLLKEYN